MGSRLRIARRELASLRTEKTIVLALMIQMFIAAFSSFLVVGLVSLYDPGSVSSAEQVEFGVAGNATDPVMSVIGDDGGWDGAIYADFDAAMADFRSGEVDAVIDADRRGDGGLEVRTVAPRSSLRTTLIVVQIKDIMERLERQERSRLSDRLTRSTVPLPPEQDSSPYFGFTYTVLIPLLMFVPVFLSGSIVSDSITEEIERDTLELLRVSPISDAELLDGKMLAMTAIAPLQAGIWLALLTFNRTLIAHPAELLVLVAALTVAVVGFGSFVALAFRDRKQAQFTYSVGILVVFVLTYLLPESPANTVAKLAVGSPNGITYAMLGVYVVGAVGAYFAARRFVGRVEME